MKEECIFLFPGISINSWICLLKTTRQPYLRGGTGASFPTRKILLWPLAGCKRCPGVHASHDVKQSVFSEKNGYSFGFSRYGCQKSVYSHCFKQPCGYFFENNVNNIDINQFRDRVHDTIVQEIQRTSKYV